MRYADYRFYQKNWSGLIPKNEYDGIATMASQQIRYLTQNRTNIEPLDKETRQQVQLCQCELADHLYQRKQSFGLTEEGGYPVKSVTVDKYKEEYALPTASAKTYGEIDRVVVGICQKWLTQPVNLMYAGVE